MLFLLLQFNVIILRLSILVVNKLLDIFFMYLKFNYNHLYDFKILFSKNSVGSTDLRHHHGRNSNYSLDRKLLSSSTSASSSPPLAMTSLMSLPLASSRKLVSYDSLENVRKPLNSGSPNNKGHGNR